MKVAGLRCKRCKSRFTAVPYLEGGGLPEYCAACVQLVRGEKEVQIKCQGCHQRFTVVQQDERRALPAYCVPCARAARRDAQAHRASIDHAGASGIYSFPARAVTARFAPKVERLCEVWWDRTAKVLRGDVIEIPARPLSQWWRWDDAVVIYEAEATSIADLVALMSRFGVMDAQIQQMLHKDIPLNLRAQMGLPSAD
jgi:hypothetical protein